MILKLKLLKFVKNKVSKASLQHERGNLNMKKMTEQDVLNNLKKLVGKEFDSYDEIIEAFGNFEEGGETEVIVNESSNNGYDYIAYINTENSTEFLFTVDKEEIDGEIIERISNVWIA